MRRLVLAIVAISALSFNGCSWYDAMFSVAGDHYSGGGTSWQEKQDDYNEAARSYGANQ